MSTPDAASSNKTIRDGLRLSIGTFTIIQVQAPERVDKPRAAIALLFAPFAFAFWALLVGLLLEVGHALGLASLPLAAAGVTLLVFGNRAFHLDGLADTVDAFAASFDRERSLEVARLGNIGPAGLVAVVLTIVLQVAAGAVLFEHEYGVWVFITLACLARGASVAGALVGVPAARPEGWGETFSQSIPRWAGLIVWFVLIAACGGVALATGLNPWQAVSTAIGAGIAVAWLVRHCVVRLGGIIGDALGAAVEIAFTVLLLGFAF